MNQVQEMVAVTPGREAEAIARLEGLLAMMAVQPGFLAANIGRGIEDPSRLLALHAWETIEHWQTYQASKEKVDFIASRAAGLYEFATVGMNWQVESVTGDLNAGSIVRRTLYKEGAGPRLDGAVAGRTCRYVDDLPQFAGAMLQICCYDNPESYRKARVPVGRKSRSYLVDEGFEVQAKRTAAALGATAAQPA
jgi:heme-degrading monooxygenase HmoA